MSFFTPQVYIRRLSDKQAAGPKRAAEIALKVGCTQVLDLRV